MSTTARHQGGATLAPENKTGLTAPHDQAHKETTNTRHSTGLHSQTRKLLDLLRTGPVTTCELIERHGIIRPGARAHDLRAAGFAVLTERIVERDEKGRPHRRIARYHLATGSAA